MASHFPRTEDWTLQVKYPQRRDSGIYECQVSTTPPIGHSMHLSVVGKFTSMLFFTLHSCVCVSQSSRRISLSLLFRHRILVNFISVERLSNGRPTSISNCTICRVQSSVAIENSFAILTLL